MEPAESGRTKLALASKWNEELFCRRRRHLFPLPPSLSTWISRPKYKFLIRMHKGEEDQFLLAAVLRRSCVAGSDPWTATMVSIITRRRSSSSSFLVVISTVALIVLSSLSSPVDSSLPPTWSHRPQIRSTDESGNGISSLAPQPRCMKKVVMEEETVWSHEIRCVGYL